MNRTSLIVAASVLFSLARPALGSAESPAFSCTGHSVEDRSIYVASVFFDEVAGRPYRVRAFRFEPFGSGWHLLGDFTAFDDTTPTGPTDIVYRYVFRAEGAEDGEPAVMLTAGGFTGGTTAAVVRVGDDDEEPAVAIMPCNGEPIASSP